MSTALPSSSFPTQQVLGKVALFAILGLPLIGCQSWQEPEAGAKTPSRQERGENAAIAVDVALARPEKLHQELEYTGTTAPVREVSLRAQVEGQLQQLAVDVGDAVRHGEILARLDDNLLAGGVNQAKAEKAAQLSGVASAQSQVGDASIKLEQARLQFQQAQADVIRLQASLNASIEQARLEAQQTQADAARLSKLAREGAAAAQIAEQAHTKARQAQQILRNQQVDAERQISQAKTTAQTAAKIIRSAEAQVKIERQKVAASQAQVNAQRALITQAQTRQSYATLRSPLTGKVLQRLSEPGNLVQPGTEILKLGDFSRIKIVVEVSELQLSQVKLGQIVPVKIDAFGQTKFTGTVTQISPAADPKARLVPLEITLNNPQGNIGSGLLARVSFPQDEAKQIIVPETAMQENSTLFVIKKEGQRKKVEARAVTTGNKADGKVEILSGLSVGEGYVIRSSKPLRNGSIVEASALSPKDNQ